MLLTLDAPDIVAADGVGSVLEEGDPGIGASWSSG